MVEIVETWNHNHDFLLENKNWTDRYEIIKWIYVINNF